MRILNENTPKHDAWLASLKQGTPVVYDGKIYYFWSWATCDVHEMLIKDNNSPEWEGLLYAHVDHCFPFIPFVF